MGARSTAIVSAGALLLTACAVTSTGPANSGTGSSSESSTAVTSVHASASPPVGFPGVTSQPPRGTAGAYLPARSATPGATNPAVTQATIAATICRSGFTASIRPPVSYTDALKVTELAHGYAVGGNQNPAAYEEDHLIPLELGGSPTSVLNLWPEPWERSSAHPSGFAPVGTGAQTKDRIEDSLRSRVCDHQLKLQSAQHLIAMNWRAAFDTYIGATGTSTVTAPRSTPAPARTLTSTSLPIVPPGAFCSPPGARGLTRLGTLMGCKLDSKGLRYRWGGA